MQISTGNLFEMSWIFITSKRSLGQCNIFTPVCHSVHRGGSVSVHAGIPPYPPGPHTPPPPPNRRGTDTPHTPGNRHPPPHDQTNHPPWTMQPPMTMYPPGTMQPPGPCIPLDHATPQDHAAPPPRTRDIWSVHGRYTS